MDVGGVGGVSPALSVAKLAPVSTTEQVQATARDDAAVQAAAEQEADETSATAPSGANSEGRGQVLDIVA